MANAPRLRATVSIPSFLLSIAAMIAVLAASSTVQAQAPIRSFDGTGNNVDNPDWGSADTSYLRMDSTTSYTDGFSSPYRGYNARDISNAVGVQQGPDGNSRNLTSFVWQWGQFLDHDIALTHTHATESMPIMVDDPSDPLNGMIPMSRSEYDPLTGVTNTRQQLNSNSTYIDASMVYGSSLARSNALRSFSGGKLEMSAVDNLLPRNIGGLQENANGGQEADETLFLAGDVRANEQAGLTAMHTVFAREHNRLAMEIASQNPLWTDEEIFQHARKIVGGMVQSITYNEYLPTLMGGYAPSISGAQYDPNTSAMLSNEFATAAFRLGHTQVTSSLMRVDDNGQTAPGGHLALANAFFKPSLISDSQEIDYLIKGLSLQLQQATDLMIVDDLRNMLFGAPGNGGMDLMSLNIQRGRDHGLSTYNEIAEIFGITAPTTFAELTSDQQLQNDLASVYSDVGEVDLWVGLLAEDKVAGTEVGHVLGLLLEDEFSRLMNCDRFFFTWDKGLSQSEIDMIMNTRLSDILLRNTSLTSLASNVFVAIPEPTGAMLGLALGFGSAFCRRRRLAG